MYFILPLAALSLTLASLTHYLAGESAIDLFGLERLGGITIFPIGFLLCLALVLVIQSMVHAPRHKQSGTNQIDVARLWRTLRPRIHPWIGCLVMLLMGYGISGTGDLNEIYRITTTKWWDALLWRWEAPIFSMLRHSWLDLPVFWDRIYFLFWSYLFISIAIVFHAGNLRKFLVLACATIIAFYLTRTINLFFPTMGPAFWKPDLFELTSTSSGQVQHYLRLYMIGGIRQTGLFPATMAMPSLHVGLTAMAAWALAGEKRWTLWLSIPWLLLTWASTVMLGWHYLLDGLGGILVVAFSLVIATYAVRRSEIPIGIPAAGSSNRMVSRSD